MPRGDFLYELADPESGECYGILDPAWPGGLQERLIAPVALLIDKPKRLRMQQIRRDFGSLRKWQHSGHTLSRRFLVLRKHEVARICTGVFQYVNNPVQYALLFLVVSLSGKDLERIPGSC